MERERERKREKHNVREKHPTLPPVHTPTRDRTHSLGMCPDQESNPQPFGVWENAPTN